MGSSHEFLINDLSVFLLHLEARHYKKNVARNGAENWVDHSKMFSQSLIKHYGFPVHRPNGPPFSIRVTYDLLNQGKPLRRLTRILKALNANYRKSLPGWKTKRPIGKGSRRKRWQAIQRFLKKNAALIANFKYPADDMLTEGNASFNLQIASTPKEQTICIEFVKALVEAFAPEAIIRGRRQIDRPMLQRNQWIKRYAWMHRKRGWTARDIVRETQKELREGTWNQRRRLQYNLSTNTISKIAGLKIPSHGQI